MGEKEMEEGRKRREERERGGGRERDEGWKTEPLSLYNS